MLITFNLVKKQFTNLKFEHSLESTTTIINEVVDTFDVCFPDFLSFSLAFVDEIGKLLTISLPRITL